MSRSNSLYLAEDMTEPAVCSQLGGSTVVFTARCPGKATDNEDAAAVLASGPQSGVLVVADGMGGGAAGEQASKIAVESIKQEVARHTDDGVLRSAILNGIESANQQILDLGIGAATTLAAVEIQEGAIRPYHVGDSSVLVIGQRGKIKLATVAHSPVSQAVELGVLDDDEAMHHEDRHLVSNVLGSSDMRIEIGPAIRLSRYDTVLLATDGLFDNLSVDEIIDFIRKGPLEKGLLNVIHEVHHRMDGAIRDAPSKPDDFTVIAFRQAVPQAQQ